jgi:hypothetical protein
VKSVSVTHSSAGERLTYGGVVVDHGRGLYGSIDVSMTSLDVDSAVSNIFCNGFVENKCFDSSLALDDLSPGASSYLRVSSIQFVKTT